MDLFTDSQAIGKREISLPLLMIFNMDVNRILIDISVINRDFKWLTQIADEESK
jgi:hypothetical protein